MTKQGSGVRIVTVDGVVVVHWPRETTVEVVHEIARATIEARRVFQRPIAFVGTVHPDATPPGDAAAREYMHFNRTFASACVAQWAVLSPESPRRQLQIAVIQAMTAFNQIPMEICDSLDRAVRAAAKTVGNDPERVLRAVQGDGFLGSLAE